jgi:hypothetical protein
MCSEQRSNLLLGFASKVILGFGPRWVLPVPKVDYITELLKKLHICNGEFLHYCHAVKYNRLICDTKE